MKTILQALACPALALGLAAIGGCASAPTTEIAASPQSKKATLQATTGSRIATSKEGNSNYVSKVGNKEWERDNKSNIMTTPTSN